MALGATALSAYVLVESLGFARLARYMPLNAAVVAVACSLLLAGLGAWSLRIGQPEPAIEQRPTTEPVDLEGAPIGWKAIRYFTWIGGYCLAIWLIGFRPSSFIFISGFYRIEARVTWPWSLGAGAVAVFVVQLLSQAGGLRFPSSVFG